MKIEILTRFGRFSSIPREIEWEQFNLFFKFLDEFSEKNAFWEWCGTSYDCWLPNIIKGNLFRILCGRLKCAFPGCSWCCRACRSECMDGRASPQSAGSRCDPSCGTCAWWPWRRGGSASSLRPPPAPCTRTPLQFKTLLFNRLY